MVLGSCAPLGRSKGCWVAPGVWLRCWPSPQEPRIPFLRLGAAWICAAGRRRASPQPPRSTFTVRGVSACPQESPPAPERKRDPTASHPRPTPQLWCWRRGPAGAGDPQWELAAGGCGAVAGRSRASAETRAGSPAPQISIFRRWGRGVRACDSLVTEINVHIWGAVTEPTVLASEDSRTCARCPSPPLLCVRCALLLKPEALGRSNEGKGR